MVKKTEVVTKEKRKHAYLKSYPLRVLVVAIIIVLVVLIGHALNKKVQQHNDAFIINGKAYSKQTIKQMALYAADNQQKNEQNLAKYIFGLYKTQTAAQSVNINPTSSEIQAQYQLLPAPKNAVQKQYNNLLAYNNALPAAYQRYANGNDVGSFFIFGFARYVEGPPVGEKAIQGFGNSKLIQQDEDYAHQQATTDYASYKTNQLTFDQLQQKIQNDQQLMVGYSEAASFDSSNENRLSQIAPPDVYSYIAKQTKPGVSQILLGKVPIKFPSTQGDYANGYYFFVDLQKASPIIVHPSGKVYDQTNSLKTTYYGV